MAPHRRADGAITDGVVIEPNPVFISHALGIVITSAAGIGVSVAAALAAAFAVLGSKVRSGVFLVVDVERRQADVEDFFLTERDDVTRGVVRLRCIRCRTNDRRGRAARQRQHPGGSQYRYGFLPMPSLRSLLL